MAATATRYLMMTIAVAVALAVLAAVPAAAETGDKGACVWAQQSFSECVSYVVGVAPSVSPECCHALEDVSYLGDSVPRRRTICRCILSQMRAAGGKLVSSRAAGLPGACNVQIWFVPTRPDFNCSAIF